MPVQSSHRKNEEPTESTLTESHEAKVARITNLELLRSHRAQPSLVEGLLLAKEVNLKMANPSSALSMELILGITKFDQRTKWLFPWGVEVIDPSRRPPESLPPETFLTRARAPLRIQNLPIDEFTSLLSDSKEQWDGVLFEIYEPSHFELLHLHPCEEVICTFSHQLISREDMENLAKCRNLRNLSLGNNAVAIRSLKAIRDFPNLQHFTYFFRHQSAAPLFQFLHAKSSISMLTIHEAHVYTASCARYIAFLVNARSDRICHIDLQCALPISIARALSLCANLKGISVMNFQESHEDGLQLVLSSPSVQKSLQSIRISCEMPISLTTFALMARCTNLRWLSLMSPGAYVCTIGPLIRVNAKHLCALNLHGCVVNDTILTAIARCKCLRFIGLDLPSAIVDSVLAYLKANRLIWMIIPCGGGMKRIQGFRHALDKSKTRR